MGNDVRSTDVMKKMEKEISTLENTKQIQDHQIDEETRRKNIVGSTVDQDLTPKN